MSVSLSAVSRTLFTLEQRVGKDISFSAAQYCPLPFRHLCHADTYTPSSHAYPSVYDSATYTLLQDTAVNSTHYTLSAICIGCSSWARSSGTRTLNPNSGFRVAWAQNTQAGSVEQPADPASSFNYHSFHGYFDADLKSAKVPDADFEAAAAMTLGAAPAAAVGEAEEPAPAQPGPVPGWPWGPWGS